MHGYDVIVIDQNGSLRGGAQRELCSWLGERPDSWKVAVVIPEGDLKYALPQGVDVFSFRTGARTFGSPVWWLRTAIDVFAALRRFGPSVRSRVVIANGPLVVVAAWMWARRWDAHLIWHVHRGVPRGLVRSLGSFVCWYSKGQLVFVSDALKLSLGRSDGWKWSVIYNHVPDRCIQETGRTFVQPLRVAVVGTIHPQRSQLTVIRELVALLRAGVVELVLYGSPSDRVGRKYLERCVRFVRCAQLEGVVRFAGYVEMTADVWYAIDIMVNVVHESFGKATVEALGHGCLVVLADHPVSREIGANACSYVRGTPGSIAKAVKEMSGKSEEELRELEHRSMLRAEELHSRSVRGMVWFLQRVMCSCEC